MRNFLKNSTMMYVLVYNRLTRVLKDVIQFILHLDEILCKKGIVLYDVKKILSKITMKEACKKELV